ncbi:hypothetical protein CE91St50_15650 [Clostridioides difficile]|nr:hypothetical protein CE91St50_15650 [Clostridioides difficile]
MGLYPLKKIDTFRPPTIMYFKNQIHKYSFHYYIIYLIIPLYVFFTSLNIVLLSNLVYYIYYGGNI